MKPRKLSAYIRPAIISLLSVFMIIAIGLAGCQLSSISTNNSKPPADNDTNDNTDSNNKNDVENNDDKEETPPPVVYYNVLTGLKTTSELAALRPVSVCIENSPYSLPQYGISNAQMLIEVPVAGGGTKLMMLTTDYRYMTTIGAVTSTRPYLAELGQAFQSIHCFNGTDKTMTEEELKNFDVLNAESSLMNGIFYHDETRFDKDDKMTNGILIDSAVRRAEIDEKLSDHGLPYVFAKEGTQVTPNGTRAIEAIIRFSDDTSAQFTYHADTGLYERSQYGTPTLDGTTGEKVTFKNVLIMYASSTTYESQNEKSMDFVFRDGGTGTYISNGQAVTFLWTMDDSGNLNFTDETGAPLTINRGTTYLGVMPVSNSDMVYIK